MTCPPDFISNCKNYIYKCGICKAVTECGPLYYKPINKEPTIKEHPSYSKQTKQIDKTKSKQVKTGLKQERLLTSKIAKQTLRSGAILHDGDLSLFDGDLKLDSKVRFNKQSFTLTKSEYTKGIKQSLDGWIITNKNDSSEDSVVVLTLSSFTKLLAYKLEHE